MAQIVSDLKPYAAQTFKICIVPIFGFPQSENYPIIPTSDWKLTRDYPNHTYKSEADTLEMVLQLRTKVDRVMKQYMAVIH